MKQKHVRVLSVVFLAALLFSTSILNINCKKKLKNFNIVVIVIDTLRSDKLDAYGYEKITAPFLTELSKKSILFENTFSASSWTSPGTASIFTSLYPFQHKVLMGILAHINAKKKYPDIKIDRIPDEIETMPEIFKKAGYATFAISDNFNIGDKQGFDQGFDKMITYSYKGAEQVNKDLFSWKEEIEKNDKYFIYLHYMDPHGPYHAREPWYKDPGNRKLEPLEAYDSEINYVDSFIKKAYEEFGWDKNTVIVVTADHGEGLWDHGRQGHGFSLYREEIQVPLIIHFPGGAEGKRIKPNVSTIDILPTLRDIIGLQKSNSDEGWSLLPLIKGEEEKYKNRYLFSYLWKKVTDLVEFKATIYKNFHFQNKISLKKELFNLMLDQKEKKNIFFKAFKIAREMELQFEKFFSNCKKYEKKSVNYKLNKERLEKLKTLGYVQE